MLSANARDRLERLGAVVFERGWLSSNNILISGSRGPSALIDSGYSSHAAQTLELVRTGLAGRPLDRLLNTHLHSDHCGGNALLQREFPTLCTAIPPGLTDAVRRWDEGALTYAPTGQQCPRFHFEKLLQPGESILLGDWSWEIHGAKGHDPHAIVLFQPDHGVLVSADALWRNGFGVVFPELEGESAFEEVAHTLDLIESLNPCVIVPGHGAVFEELDQALAQARSRLERFREFPAQHLRHAHKVLVKFKLLESRAMAFDQLLDWVQRTPYLTRAISVAGKDAQEWLEQILSELERSHAVRREGPNVINT
jgi:glyoxylase-like metal-dependent hydrolase (beta-lactamase superfamily II)